MIVRTLFFLMLASAALALGYSGLRGILQRRVVMRTKADLEGAPAVALGVVLLAASIVVAWITISIVTRP